MDNLFGSVDNTPYMQQFMAQQQQAELARQREQAAYAQQARFGQYLQAVMNGTAPSMAQLQLQQGLGAIGQQQQSMAAGQAGAGNALARYGAAMNTGIAQGQANQAAALARAQELAQARSQYGANAAAMQQASQGMYAIPTNAALSYGQLGAGIAEQNQQNRLRETGALLQGIGQSGSLFSSGGGGGGGQAPNPAAQYNANNPYPV